ncbi:DUF6221 family protein [Streptomyces angustmyceticus]|uniref:DUF6221 family protein n=1 Tax=Streptomyces angustmyceticus TaxID=285578 RepID=UPI00344E8C4B
MTAAGEDILAWLETAISRVEEAARHATQAPWHSHDTHLDHGGHTATILAGADNNTELLAWLPTMSHEPWDEARNAWRNADHIVMHDPRSVLRRCAADRKLLELHRPTWETVEWPHDQNGKGEAMTCPSCRNADPTEWHPAPGQAGTLPEGFVPSYVLAPCPTLLGLAEGYGWEGTTDSRRTEGAQTPPTDGDQMT